MKIVIPMAGLGSRFKQMSDKNPDWVVPKPLIKVKGVPMIKWATSSFPFLQQNADDVDKPVKMSDLIFLVLRQHEDESGITQQLKDIFSPEVNIVVVEQLTRGAAETAYLAKKFINSEEDVIISDSDHHFDATPLWQAIVNKDPETVGILPVITPPDTKPTWSYVKMGEGKFVEEVKEKDKYLAANGGLGILGGYYFTHGRDFINETENMIADNDTAGEAHKQEFYVSQVYHRLLAKGKKIEIAKIEKGWVLGTPEQLEYFLNNFQGPLPIL